MQVTTTNTESKGKRKDGREICIDLNLCIAAGPCAVMAEKTFIIRDSDGKALICDPDGDNWDAVVQAAQSCPVKAIMLREKNGKEINF